MAKEHLEAGQSQMKSLYHWQREWCEVCPGDHVLASLPLAGSSFQARFSGPYTVTKKVSDLNYLISTPKEVCNDVISIC